MLDLKKLAALVSDHPTAVDATVREFQLGAVHFPFNTTPAIMGVINLSGDSWYRESVCLSTERAVERGLILRHQGAAIVDVGAESTLAQAARVDDAGQQSLLLPVVKELTAAGLVVSVETYSPTVTEAALKHGARVINLTGPAESAEIYRRAAQYDAAVIICFVQAAHVRAVGNLTLPADPVPLLHDYFARETELATRCGVNKILIDPGLGFYYRNLQDSAVRVRYQLNMFLHTFRLRALGFPVCHALPHAFEYFGEQVRTAEPVFAVLAALGRTDLFRTHEVPKVRATLDLLRSA